MKSFFFKADHNSNNNKNVITKFSFNFERHKVTIYFKILVNKKHIKNHRTCISLIILFYKLSSRNACRINYINKFSHIKRLRQRLLCMFNVAVNMIYLRFEQLWVERKRRIRASYKGTRSWFNEFLNKL